MSTLKIKSRITTLGVNAGEHVEIEDTPEVRRKILDGWFVLLRPVNGNRTSLPQ